MLKSLCPSQSVGFILSDYSFYLPETEVVDTFFVCFCLCVAMLHEPHKLLIVLTGSWPARAV